MQEKTQSKFLIFVRLLELFIAALIAIAIIISLLSLIPDLWDFANNYKDHLAFSNFLGYAFNTIIGLEFFKMLIKHSAGSVIEVLLFAIARQLIVEHTTPLENLFGILAIAILFVIRRFLYVSTFDDDGNENTSFLKRMMKKKERTTEEDEI